MAVGSETGVYRQASLELGQASRLPIPEIIQVILDRGRLSKRDIRLLWDVSDEDYEVLRARLENQKLIEPGPKRGGGFSARFNRRPMPAARDGEAPAPSFRTAHENAAVARLVELLSHSDLEELLGSLVYTIRRARQQLSGEDRRGSKPELAAALLTKHGIDLLADSVVRSRIGRRLKIVSPGRWHPGKGAALRFVANAGFPPEYAGIPSADAPPDFEYLEGRADLAPLQDFQCEVQQKLMQMLRKDSGRAIVTLPTGAGKTRVAVDSLRDWLTERYAAKADGVGNVVLWLAHTDELCEQAYACFREVWQASNQVCPMLLFRFWGSYTRDLQEHAEVLGTFDQRPTVLISTPQRFVNLMEEKIAGGSPVLEALLRLAGAVVVDEAHRAAAPSYRKIIQFFTRGAQHAAIIGLTATPFREEYNADDPQAGTLELRSLFRTIVEPTHTLGEDPRRTLQERGFLARPYFSVIKTDTKLRAPAGIDTDNPSEEDIEKIDYALKLRADKPERRLAILQRLVELCRDPESLIIYFGPTVQDAECMAFLLRQRQIEAAFVSGETRDVTRRKIIAEFKAARVQVLCNCEVLTTGFDAPKVTHVVMARPTVSQVLYEQMVGRGLRGVRFGGTESCHIIDLEDQYRADRPALGYKRFREVWGARGATPPSVTR